MSLYSHRVWNHRLRKMVRSKPSTQIDLVDEWPYPMRKVDGLRTRIGTEIYQLDCLVHNDLRVIVAHPMLKSVPGEWKVVEAEDLPKVFGTTGRVRNRLLCTAQGTLFELPGFIPELHLKPIQPT